MGTDRTTKNENERVRENPTEVLIMLLLLLFCVSRAGGKYDGGGGSDDDDDDGDRVATNGDHLDRDNT